MNFSGMRSQSRGFTLIELLVAITIISILATIGLRTFLGAQAKSRDAKRKSDLAAIQKAMELYYNDCGTYPTTIGDGDIIGCGSSGSCNVGAEVCTPGEEWIRNGVTYMQELPSDPMGNYFYDWSSSGYTLFARLENTSDNDVPHSGTVPQAYKTIWCRQSPHDECNYALPGPGANLSPILIED
mgnify:CR=1 FL=1